MRSYDIYKPALLNGEPIGLAAAIGEAAMYEQLAEECAELAKASIKLARYTYGENKVHKTYEEISYNFHEEVIDVLNTIHELSVYRTYVYDDVEELFDDGIIKNYDKFLEKKTDLELVKGMFSISCSVGNYSIYISDKIRNSMDKPNTFLWAMHYDLARLIVIITVVSNRDFFDKNMADDILASKLDRMRSRLDSYAKEEKNAN